MKHEMMEAWTPDEDEILLIGIGMYSTRWPLIQKKLPHRSVNSIRNRYIRIRRGVNGPPGNNRCHHCGNQRKGHVCTKEDLVKSSQPFLTGRSRKAISSPLLSNTFMPLSPESNVVAKTVTVTDTILFEDDPRNLPREAILLELDFFSL